MKHPIKFKINISRIKDLTEEQKQLIALDINTEEDFPSETEKTTTVFTCDYRDIFYYYATENLENNTVLLIKLTDGEILTSPEKQEYLDKIIEEARKNDTTEER